MIIKNLKLIECIENAIMEYNNQFYSEEDKDKIIYYEYSEDGSITIPEEILKKLEILRIPLKNRDSDEKNLQDFIHELSELLEVMKLKVFDFSLRDKGVKFFDLDISFLEHLNKSVENLQITGVDLSKERKRRTI